MRYQKVTYLSSAKWSKSRLTRLNALSRFCRNKQQKTRNSAKKTPGRRWEPPSNGPKHLYSSSNMVTGSDEGYNNVLSGGCSSGGAKHTQRVCQKAVWSSLAWRSCLLIHETTVRCLSSRKASRSKSAVSVMFRAMMFILGSYINLLYRMWVRSFIRHPQMCKRAWRVDWRITKHNHRRDWIGRREVWSRYRRLTHFNGLTSDCVWGANGDCSPEKTTRELTCYTVLRSNDDCAIASQEVMQSPTMNILSRLWRQGGNCESAVGSMRETNYLLWFCYGY